MKRMVVLVAVAALALLSGSIVRAQDGEALLVGAGVGSGTVAGNVYAPGEVTIHAGDSVTWTIESDEPHTITFGEGPEGLPPALWEATFDVPPGPPAPVTLDDSYDGTGFINTGVIFTASTFTLTFIAEGTYPYICAIHPGMAGTVNVVAEGEPATTQEEAEAAAAQTASEILAPEESLRADTVAALASEERPDGTTLWTLAAAGLLPPGAAAEGGTGYLELLEFLPPEVTIQAGDTVRWVAPAPHTVTFMEPGQDPFALGDAFEVEAAKPSDEYDGQSFYNSGVLGLAPGLPAEFEMTFLEPGSFGYLCLLHFPLGQVGTVVVEPAAVPATGTGGYLSAGDGAKLGLLALLAGAAGTALLFGGIALRRVAAR